MGDWRCVHYVCQSAQAVPGVAASLLRGLVIWSDGIAYCVRCLDPFFPIKKPTAIANNPTRGMTVSQQSKLEKRVKSM